MASPLQNSIEFFREFGLFDVVLPFLLVFTIIFAILEKTRILGTVKIKGDEVPNKNLNSMVSFVVALLTVATANVVRTINESLPNVVLLTVIGLSFLIMVGVFMKTEEMDLRSKHMTFIIFMFVGVIAIFLNSIYDADGNSWLEILLFFITTQWSGAVVTSILFLIVMVVAIWFITKQQKEKKEAS